MKNKKNYTQVIMYRGDWDVKIKEKLNVSFIYALTPNAYSEVIGKTDLPIKLSNELFSNYRQKKIIIKLKKFERVFKGIISQNNDISEAGKESALNYSYILLSSYLSIFETLKTFGPWLILVQGTWKKIENINEAAEILFYRRFVAINKIEYKNSIQPGKIVINLINNIIIKYFVKKKSFWITGISYNLKNISDHLIKFNNSYSSLYILKPDELSIFRSLKSLFTLLTIRKSNISPIGIIPIKSQSKNYKKDIFKTLKIFQNQINKNTQNIIIDTINDVINESECYVQYLEKFFKLREPSFVIAHHLRWKESTNIGLAAKNKNIPVYLISHGSHSVSNDKVSKLVLNRLSDGMLTSGITKKTVLQSPLAFKAALESKKDFEKIFVKPIMWGHETKIQKVGNKNEFTILFAGTYKLLGSRLWIYENSNEFFYGLKLLINSIKNIKNIRLIIRIREEPIEFDLVAMRKLLPASEKWEFSLTKSFKYDLERSDMLISYSSTTIEEGLYANKPIGIYGGSLRYRHINTNKIKNLRSPVYHLTHENLENEIIKIKSLHHNKPLLKCELNSYVWDNSIMSKNFFLKSLVDTEKKIY